MSGCAMADEAARARLSFSNAALAGIVTTVGDKKVLFAEEGPALGLEPGEVSRLQRAIGLEARQIVSGDTTTVDLCEMSARRLLAGLEVPASSVSGLILVTQTPDHAAPASAMALQDRLGLPVTSMAFDVNLGCSGFVYGLSLAFSLVEAGLERVLLAVGDVASRFVDPTDHVVAPIMGDAGAVALIERRPSRSWFELYSDGSGQRALYIPNSGLKRDPRDEGKASVMTMDGAAVFNFTLQRIPDLINEILAYSGKPLEDIDYFVLHQPNRYILKNIQKRLKVPEEKFPSSTQSVFGNQNSASIPGTISGFLSEPFSSKRLTSVIAGFGIGLSWGAAVIETDRIFAPTPQFGMEQK
jgi:3-oxoacyl-[acyl-carrier-protein] synthase-3